MILKKTRRALSQCKDTAEIFQDSTEMRQALLDVFVALIYFWAEASKNMREMTPGTLCCLCRPQMRPSLLTNCRKSYAPTHQQSI